MFYLEPDLYRRLGRLVRIMITSHVIFALALTAEALGATKETTGKWHLVYTHADYAQDSFLREVVLDPNQQSYVDSVNKITYLDSTCVNKSSVDVCADVKRIDVSQIDDHTIKVAIVREPCGEPSWCEASIRLRVTVYPYIQKTEDVGSTSTDTSGEWLPKKPIVVVVPGNATSATVVAQRGSSSVSLRLPNKGADSTDPKRFQILSCLAFPPPETGTGSCAMQPSHMVKAQDCPNVSTAKPGATSPPASSLIYEIVVLQDLP